MMRSVTPGRAMTSCGKASSEKISMAARKRSASYIIATGSAFSWICRLRAAPALDGRVDLGGSFPVELNRVSVVRGRP